MAEVKLESMDLIKCLDFLNLDGITDGDICKLNLVEFIECGSKAKGFCLSSDSLNEVMGIISNSLSKACEAVNEI